MKYVSCMGDVFRVSDRNYRNYLKAVAAGDRDADLEKFGAKFVCSPTNVTDIAPGWAEYLLSRETKKE